MGGVEPDGLCADSAVVAAHGAPVLVGDQDELAEPGVAAAEPGDPVGEGPVLERLRVEAHQPADVGVQRLREVRIEQGVGQQGGQARVTPQRLLEGRVQPAPGARAALSHP